MARNNKLNQFRIEEVTSVHSPSLAGMKTWLIEIFPEYAPPRFESLLTRLRHPDSRHELQIFIGQSNGQVAGLVQVFYREWQNGLLADIDLLGVLEPHRCKGLGTALVKRAIQATWDMAGRYGLQSIGVVSLIEPSDATVIRLHKKLGGQIRTDYLHPSGDIIAWHPLLRDFATVETGLLAQQLQQFAFLLV